ncbi:unnamed protein product [marine sediment metagenome]|uniref:Histidine biosynthesis HisG C-terminal domain-containing protein n=1 Tax=marine sediment metagenome TaxID=412755 RepID=X1FGP7_9ZZZZ
MSGENFYLIGNGKFVEESQTIFHNLPVRFTPHYYTNPTAWTDSWKREKIKNIAILLEGALNGMGKVGLKMNISQANLKKLLDVLPALKKPTISKLSEEG